jgi:hypothetical protein
LFYKFRKGGTSGLVIVFTVVFVFLVGHQSPIPPSHKVFFQATVASGIDVAY